MSVAVGVKVMCELVAALGALIVMFGLALRGGSRYVATVLGAAVIALSGLVLLVESTFRLLDANRIPSALLMLVFGSAVAAWHLHTRKVGAQSGD